MFSGKINTVIIFLISLLLISCEKSTTNNFFSEYDYVKYGTSFGECIGYCKESITISDSIIEFEKSGWGQDDAYPVVSFSETINNDYWTTLLEHVDFENFIQLDTVIGCPDCADGGAEWIEIKKSGKVRKTTFEFGNEPEKIKMFVGYLRTYLEAFNTDSLESIKFEERTLIDQVGKIKTFLCSPDCFQYVIELVGDTDTVLYFDKYLDSDFYVDNLGVNFNGVLQSDSTMIYRTDSVGKFVPYIKLRNIRTFGMTLVSD